MSFKTYVKPLVTTDRPLTALAFGGAVTITAGTPCVAHFQATPERPDPYPELQVTSSDAGVAVAALSHNNSINVLGLKAGTATITVTDGTLSADLDVTVEAYKPPVFPPYTPPAPIPATALVVTEATKKISIRQQFDVGAIVTPYNFTVDSVQWSSSDTDVAIVADLSRIEHNTGIYRNGHVATVRGIKAGTATITATIGALTASCTVTVI